MSEYSFGYEESDDTSGLGESQNQQQGPKWFREGLDKLSSQVKELKAENDRLKADKTRSQVQDALKAKGFDPAAAGLYAGEAEKLDDWLGTHGAALAKLPADSGEGGEEGQPPAGPPATTVPADAQAQMRSMQEAGATGAAQPQGSDKELAAAIAAARTPEEFEQIMKANGNRYDWS